MMCSLGAEGSGAMDLCLRRVTLRLGSPARLGSGKDPAKRHLCGFGPSALPRHVPVCGYAFVTRRCGGSLRGGLYPKPSQSPSAADALAAPRVLLAWRWEWRSWEGWSGRIS